MSKENKLNGKDLVNIGIFSAIYGLIVAAFSMIGYFPVLYPCIAIVVPLIGGIPFMLFITKVKKFGMIWIMAIIMGLFMIVTGMGVWPLVVAIVCGPIADLIYKSGKFISRKKAVLSYSIFGLWIWGNFLMVFFQPEKYFATRQSFGQDYIDSLTNIMQPFMCPVLLVVTFLFGLLGGFIGLKMLKKHFEKAGIV